ncbi:desmoplakin [Parapoynx stagnalis nucleopolyhedrovirus]|uniref:Desmoplakin n=1 Tax=Parapoynx stagnalis nucleopolyhedrovirus TaxID=2993413 RepID=A0A9E8BWI9_9ABAC|nr:desmoplakin [Parapoynx stagnalis nucleopolyhedrovirus]
MQRWPKYGNTDVDTRTVHDLLNTINTLSTRVKTLERYERALREIHKVIVILKPTANIQSFDVDALPSLVMKSLSDFVGKDINTLTHNINYKYDYNMPYPFPGPTPSIPPQPPQPPTFPPYPPFPYYQYPYGPPSQPSSQPPPQPSQTPAPSQAPEPEIVKKIDFTPIERQELESIYNQIVNNNINLSTYELYMNFLIKIMKVYFSSTQIVQTTETLKTDINILIEYDFKEFLFCIQQETKLVFVKNQLLCKKISAFIIFFLQVFSFYYKKEFAYNEQTDVKKTCEDLFLEIRYKFETITSLQNQLKDDRSQLQQLREISGTSEKNVTSQRELVASLNDRIEQLRVENEKLHETAVRDREEWQRQLQVEKMEVGTEQYDTQIVELNSLNENLKAEVYQLQLQNNELNSKLNQVISERGIAHNQLAVLNTTETDLKQKLQQLNAVNEQLKAQIQLYARNEQFTIPISKFIETIEHLYNSLAATKSDVDLDFKIHYVLNWLDNILSRDLLNLQAIKDQRSVIENQYNDLRSQIFSRLQGIKTDLIQSIKSRDPKFNPDPNQVNDFEDVDLVAGVTMLDNKSKEILNKNIEASKRAKDCTLKIERLEKELQEVTSDVKKMSQFTVSPSKKLNDQSYQDLQQSNIVLQSQLEECRNLNDKKLEDIANESVRQELSKLNDQIMNINSLFAKYDSSNKDIFEWKAKILQMYETLARSYSQK